MDAPSSWSGRLSRLDVDRECTAGASVEDRCWLCDHLDDWNSVLSAVQFKLVEQQPGKLCLRTHALKSPDDFNRNGFPYDAGYVIAWLPRKHWCVEELYLERCNLHVDDAALPGPLPGLRPPGLRKIFIRGNLKTGYAHFNWAAVLDSIGPFERLESLCCRGLYVVTDSFASQLARVLSFSASSVTELRFSGGATGGRPAGILFSGIANCKMLRKLRFAVNCDQNSLAQLTKCLQSMETLEVLSLREGRDGDCERDVSAVGELLRKSTWLSTFRFQPLTPHGLIECLEALETNTALRYLVISGNHFAEKHIGRDVGVSLRSMLARNRGLHSLTLFTFKVDYEAAVLISEGLQENGTLKRLCVSHSKLLFPAELALYNAMKKNTMVQLRLDCYGCSAAERHALSAEVDRNKWYSRIPMEWDDSHAVGLSASLLDQSLCPTELCLDTSHFTDESFSMLCRALSSSLHVRGLTVTLSNATPAQVSGLHKVLSENTSLECVTLQETCGDIRGSSVVASQGLCFNDSVTELLIKFEDLDTMLVELVALLLETNETLCKVTLMCSRELEPGYVDAISQALLVNKVITDFSFLHGRSNADSSTVCSRRAVQRNVVRLHRAVRFVLGQDVGKACAEAFELFEEKASLVPCVISASGMSPADAVRAVKSARQFIWANYFIITKVVCQKLECHAAGCTQIDQLNEDCWQAITQYLMVSDIVDN